MGIHLVLGAGLAGIACFLAPPLASHVVGSDPVLRADCLGALRAASITVLLRAIETVCVSTQRGFERYGPAVYISVSGRIAAMLAAAGLASADRSVTEMLLANAGLMAICVALQIRDACTLLQTGSMAPKLDRACLRPLLGFGVLSWILAASSVVVGQADRLFTGAAMGAAAVAAYALCVQITQPLYGIASSGLHFLFPYLASRAESVSPAVHRAAILRAVAANVALVAGGGALLLFCGRSLLRLLGGSQIAATAAPLLPLILCGTALLALTVTPYYVLLAAGQARTVAFVNVAAALAMLLCMARLAASHGLDGIVLARLLYGLITALLYLPLLRILLPEAAGRTGSLLLPAQVAVGPTHLSRSERQNRNLGHGRV
jgi:O-antigen/teichoic acid export membrane protein